MTMTKEQNKKTIELLVVSVVIVAVAYYYFVASTGASLTWISITNLLSESIWNIQTIGLGIIAVMVGNRMAFKKHHKQWFNGAKLQ